MKRDLFLKYIDKFLPEAEVEDCRVCLHAKRVFDSKTLSKVLHLEVVRVNQAEHVVDGLVSQKGTSPLLLHKVLVLD